MEHRALGSFFICCGKNFQSKIVRVRIVNSVAELYGIQMMASQATSHKTG